MTTVSITPPKFISAIIFIFLCGLPFVEPLALYFKDSRVKVSVGLCKGKKLYDKRQTAAKQDAQRQIRRAVKEHYA